MTETEGHYGKEVHEHTGIMFKWVTKSGDMILFPLVINTIMGGLEILCEPEDIIKEGIEEVVEKIQRFMGKNKKVLDFFVNGTATFYHGIAGTALGVIDMNKAGLQGEAKIQLEFVWQVDKPEKVNILKLFPEG